MNATKYLPKAKRTTAPNHAHLIGQRVTAIFGSARRVPGWIDDTTVTDRGTVCVSISPVLENDVDCSGVWTSEWAEER